MFLSLLTADAAASHGHEFSGARPPSPSKRSPIPGFSIARSPLRALSAPSRPKAALEVVRSRPQWPVESGVGVSPSQVESTLATAPQPSGSPDGIPAPNLNLVSHLDQAPSSPPTSQSSRRTSERREKQRRPRTSFNFAHPPPRGNPLKKAKSLISPNTVLQLFKISTSSRHIPAFEVVQSSLFSPALSRSSACLHPRRLGANDTVILEAEKYGNSNEMGKGERSKWDGRKALSVICSCGQDTRISMDGAAWRISSLPNGRFDFIPVGDATSNTPEIRWVRARQDLGSRRGRGSISTSCEARYTFSTILPDSRRHPVIAIMTATELDILDEYSLPTCSASSSGSSVFAGGESQGEARNPPTIYTDERLRDIICVTGLWVTLQQCLCSPKKDSHTAVESTTAKRRVSFAQVTQAISQSKRLSRASYDIASSREMPASKPVPSGAFQRLIDVFRRRKDD